MTERFNGLIDVGTMVKENVDHLDLPARGSELKSCLSSTFTTSADNLVCIDSDLWRLEENLNSCCFIGLNGTLEQFPHNCSASLTARRQLVEKLEKFCPCFCFQGFPDVWIREILHAGKVISYAE
jgi:hypothetical protein